MDQLITQEIRDLQRGTGWLVYKLELDLAPEHTCSNDVCETVVDAAISTSQVRLQWLLQRQNFLASLWAE